MSTYDQLSLSKRPTLYLSSPAVTDQSGSSAYTLASNNLDPSGQPIIYGNNSSFRVTDTTTVSVVGNPLFFKGKSFFECVAVIPKPTQQVAILIDDNDQNALVVTSKTISLKLFFEAAASIYSKIISVRIDDWSKKFYIRLGISDSQATLTVNDKTVHLEYDDVIVNSNNLVIGGGYSGYFYLLDGIAFYNGTAVDKKNVIDDAGSGHAKYISTKYGATYTKFDGQTIAYQATYTLGDFKFTPSPNIYSLDYYVSDYNFALDYIHVHSSDENTLISYIINLSTTPVQFYADALIDSIGNSVITLYFNAAEVSSDIRLTITSVGNVNIETNSPAILTLAGMAEIRPGQESIVNYPDTTTLVQSTYTGTWISDSPKSIELVFKPKASANDIVIFACADGQASYGPTGSITGYTAYLNGAVVTDLTNIKVDQWNHLVLVNSSPTAAQFYLNSTDGVASTDTISYMLLAAYPVELLAADAAEIYNNIAGTDDLQILESSITVTETNFVDTSSPFNYYSYAWSIIGAGGS